MFFKIFSCKDMRIFQKIIILMVIFLFFCVFLTFFVTNCYQRYSST